MSIMGPLGTLGTLGPGGREIPGNSNLTKPVIISGVPHTGFEFTYTMCSVVTDLE